MIKHFTLLFGFCFITVYSIYGQKNNETKSLALILTELREQHNTHFNYDADVIKGIFIKSPPVNSSLNNALLYLQKNTQFLFVLINTSLVIVKPKDKIVICGYIKDHTDNLPLVSVTIQGLKNSTVSDKNGFFQLEVNSVFEQISIRFVGYNTITKSFNNLLVGKCGNIFMKPSYQSISTKQLSKNTVYVTGTAGTLSQVSVSYERQIHSGENVNWYGRIGVGTSESAFTIPHGLGGLGAITMLLKGKKNGHFEVNAGAFVGKESDKTFVHPILNIGYRYQEPKDGFIFKANIGIVAVSLSLGYAF